MKIKLPKLLFRYIVEGVLIFVSVYGAFLLEDYRSKSEQKEIFSNRWEGLINSMSTDSLKFRDLLYDIDVSNIMDQDESTFLNINEWLKRDSTVLADYDDLIDKGDIRPIIEAVRSGLYWPMSYIGEPTFFQDIIDNHPDHYLEVCKERPQLCEWLDLYIQYYKRIDRFNRFSREMHITYWGKISDSYLLAGPVDTMGIAKDFRSRNYLSGRFRHSSKLTLPTLEAIVELNKKLASALRDFDME